MQEMDRDNTNEKMVVMQDKRTTYDLGGNPTEKGKSGNYQWIPEKEIPGYVTT